jgi:hypothetical protein
VFNCLGGIVLWSFSVVAGGSVGCSLILGGLGVVRSLCLVVAWSRVILGPAGVVNWGNIRGCVTFGLLSVVVVGGPRCSNWSLRLMLFGSKTSALGFGIRHTQETSVHQWSTQR